MKREEYKARIRTQSLNWKIQNYSESQKKRGSGIGYRASGKAIEGPSNLADKWILSRANRAAHDVRAAFERYDINAVTKSLYDFIWGDYCDWYLEIVKIQPDSIPLAVEILEGILRMLHPIMPFVTEELWHALTGEPESVLLGRDDYITPDEGKIDEKAEYAFSLIQDTIEAIRLVRSTLKLAPSKKAEIVLQARGIAETITHTGLAPYKLVLDILESGRAIIERLGNASSLTFEEESANYSSREYVSEIRTRVRVLVKIEQRSSEEQAKERERVAKELERVLAQIEQTSAKLSNPGFLERAPEPVLEKEREKHRSYLSQVRSFERA